MKRWTSQNLLRLRWKTPFAHLSPPADSGAFSARYSSGLFLTDCVKPSLWQRLADHTRKNKCRTMHPWSSRAVWRFTRIYLHDQTAVDAGGIRTWWTTGILITGKTRRCQFEPQVGIKMEQVLGSPFNIFALIAFPILQELSVIIFIIWFLFDMSIDVNFHFTPNMPKRVIWSMNNKMVSNIWVGLSATNFHLLQFQICSHF